MALLIILQRRLLGDARRFVTVQGKAKAPRKLHLGALRYPLSIFCWLWVTALVLLPLAGLVLRSISQVLTPYISPLKVLTLRSEEHTSELQSLMRISYAV